jgi:probable rRNA maturation factor
MSKRHQRFRIEVLSHRGRIDARWVIPLCKKILASELRAPIRVNVVATDNKYIRQLNRDYRGRNHATDVLAFNLCDEDDSEEQPLLGEIYISCEKARQQAAAYHHCFREEVRRLVAHGLLHLLGYDHEDDKSKKRMQEKEEVYLTGRKVITA